jgi:hypothetical protein
MCIQICFIQCQGENDFGGFELTTEGNDYGEFEFTTPGNDFEGKLLRNI